MTHSTATFKARARTVDMLGRQQIAGVPNAISELFKNAHDAYADTAVADYFLSDGLVVIRDDGLGMTEAEFRERWLTLGTESKLAGQTVLAPPPTDPGKSVRVIAGEKGIGRLAIAAIGPQVLIVSKAVRPQEGGTTETHPLMAAFIHWGMFELPGLNLDQIEIPIYTFPANTLPTLADVREMVRVVRDSLLKATHDQPSPDTDKILAQLDKFAVSPADLAPFLKEPGLEGKGRGTHFYILPSAETIAEDVLLVARAKETSRLQKLLLSFTNTMVPESVAPEFQTAFRFWETEENYEDLIGEGEFFTPNEFTSADHHISGRFDEFGQFVGTVQVYDQTMTEQVILWQSSKSKRTTCGPFSINIGYFQGTPTTTSLPPDEFTRLREKLYKIGGLYIYRNGIRILPYGDADFDFLGLETRRARHASFYFFTFRRMMGAIELTREKNGALAEKAGREGFQENKAYREFRDILINFFLRLAATYFREDGEYAQAWLRRREELQREEAARRAREDQSKKQRREVEKGLRAFFQKVERREPEKRLKELLEEVEAKFGSDDEWALLQTATAPLEAELEFGKALASLRKVYIVERPAGFGLDPALQREWDAYEAQQADLEAAFLEAERRAAERIREASARLGTALDRRKRFGALWQATEADARGILEQRRKEVQDALQGTTEEVRGLLKRVQDGLDEQVAETRAAYEQAFDTLSDEELERQRRIWQEELAHTAQEQARLLEFVRDQLGTLQWSPSSTGDLMIGPAEMTAALETELLALRERYDEDLELNQIGMAIEIIQHEFDNSVRAIRQGLRRLKGWSDANPDLQPTYRDLRTSFEHLDGYLTLFTPFRRRLYRTPIEIRGSDIAKFLHDLFGERLKEHDIRLSDSKAFRQTTILGYPSAFYPVFVNLVDNAIYWLQDVRDRAREIRLDEINGSLVVADNGPGVRPRDRVAIFELGFTRKPGGRGYGLHIAREVLKRENYRLELSEPLPEWGQGATFLLTANEKPEEGEGEEP